MPFCLTELHPIKQGLKLPYQGALPSANDAYRATSNKTRIETPEANWGIMPASAYRATSNKTRIETTRGRVVTNNVNILQSYIQ